MDNYGCSISYRGQHQPFTAFGLTQSTARQLIEESLARGATTATLIHRFGPGPNDLEVVEEFDRADFQRIA